MLANFFKGRTTRPLFLSQYFTIKKLYTINWHLTLFKHNIFTIIQEEIKWLVRELLQWHFWDYLSLFQGAKHPSRKKQQHLLLFILRLWKMKPQSKSCAICWRRPHRVGTKSQSPFRGWMRSIPKQESRNRRGCMRFCQGHRPWNRQKQVSKDTLRMYVDDRLTLRVKRNVCHKTQGAHHAPLVSYLDIILFLKKVFFLLHREGIQILLFL